MLKIFYITSLILVVVAVGYITTDAASKDYQILLPVIGLMLAAMFAIYSEIRTSQSSVVDLTNSILDSISTIALTKDGIILRKQNITAKVAGISPFNLSNPILEKYISTGTPECSIQSHFKRGATYKEI